jgi:cell wall assembly regulator SMI1
VTEIRDPGQPIGEQEVAAFECELGARLPADYRQFLLTNNGGRPVLDVVDIAGLLGSPTDVQVFFGLRRKFESSQLSWNLQLIAQRCLGQRVLPIACDSGGNLFCLQVSDGDGGTSSVVYLDMADAACTAHAVAGTFGEFLQKLQTWDD